MGRTQPEAREGKAGRAGVAERSVVPQNLGNSGGGKGPQFRRKVERNRKPKRVTMRLPPPEKVRKLQQTLHEKAKANPTYRFYALYDKLYREDVLHYAWRCCRHNGGKPGVDGMSFAQIERIGVEAWLEGVAEELREKRYSPEAVRRVMIPKPNGKQRPLGIPTIKDRVVQMAAVIVLSPIFEADLCDEQYAYREGRSAHGAVREIHHWISRGHHEVLDADLSGYFDTIPHPELIKSLARRISDGAMLKLLKQWLQMPVEETGPKGGKRRTNPAKHNRRGTPQGAPISPLLSNLYMRRFILGWKQQGWERRLEARIVNYADDFVILCKSGGHEAAGAMRTLMERLKLTVNEEKTKVCTLPKERFEFLGYEIGRCYSSKTGRSFWGTRPSRKSIQSITSQISRLTCSKRVLVDTDDVVQTINQKLVGWGNYFSLGPVSAAYRAVDQHARSRVRRWLCRKHKVPGKGTRRFPDRYLAENVGLVCLQSRRRIHAHA